MASHGTPPRIVLRFSGETPCSQATSPTFFCTVWRSLHDRFHRGSLAPRNEHLWPRTDRAGPRPGLPSLGRQRQGIPGCAGRHCREHAGAQPPQAGACAARPAHQAHPHLQLLPLAAARSAGCQAGGTLWHDQRVLLQLGAGSQRGGHQDRTQIRRGQGHRQARDRGLRKGLPRPLHRHHVGHRQPQDLQRLWPSGRGLHPRATERHRGHQATHRGQPQRGGGVL